VGGFGQAEIELVFVLVALVFMVFMVEDIPPLTICFPQIFYAHPVNRFYKESNAAKVHISIT
jgi:hypothetical protein